jgi:hypothetical protein
MTNKEYRQAMREAKKEYKQWLKDLKTGRLMVRKEAAKIRKATLSKNN